MKRFRGFTLIELAVVIFIITLLASSLLFPLAAQIEQRKIAETQKTMDEIKEALIGYAAANKQLPCPAVSATDGTEGPRNAGECLPVNGSIPWVALGVSKLDAWGHIFQYHVSPKFTNSASLAATGFQTPGNITVKTRDPATGALLNLTRNNDVVAAVLSYGKNGYYSLDAQGNAQAAPPVFQNVAGNDEHTNGAPAAGAARIFISRLRTDPNPNCNEMSGGTTPCEFDDMMVWLPPYLLFNRLIEAGQMP